MQYVLFSAVAQVQSGSIGELRVAASRDSEMQRMLLYEVALMVKGARDGKRYVGGVVY